MSEMYDVGTPVGGERKYRRVRSPLQETGGMIGDNNDDGELTALPDATRALEFTEPHTPPGVQAEAPVTFSSMTKLLNEKLKRMRAEMDNIQARLGDVEKGLGETCARVPRIEQRADSPSPSMINLSMEAEINKKIAEIEEKLMNLMNL